MHFLVSLLPLILAAPSILADSGIKRASFTLSNGQTALSLTQKFASLTPSSSCTTEGENACISDSFATCVGGKFVLQPCSAPLVCRVLPLVNSPGTSITCDTAGASYHFTLTRSMNLMTCPFSRRHLPHRRNRSLQTRSLPLRIPPSQQTCIIHSLKRQSRPCPRRQVQIPYALFLLYHWRRSLCRRAIRPVRQWEVRTESVWDWTGVCCVAFGAQSWH